MLVHSS